MHSSIGLLGKKLGMTHIFDGDGNSVPVTVVQAGPCPVVQVRTPEKNGYSSIQIGYESIKKHKLNKPTQGHFEKAGVQPTRYLTEFRTSEGQDYQVGHELNVAQFQVGDKVDVRGQHIGKGFMGATKRHHFGRGPMSHGSKSHRIPGSIGAGTTPSRVYKGLKMSGRKPAKVTTQKKLQVVAIDADRNLLLLKGCTPGSTGALLTIIPTVKVGK